MRRPRPQFKKDSLQKEFPLSIETFKQKLSEYLQNSPDLAFKQLSINGKDVIVFFISYQIDSNQLDNQLLAPLLNSESDWDYQKLVNDIPLGSAVLKEKIEDVATALIAGSVGVYVDDDKQAVTYNLSKKENRPLEKAETESLVLGPQVAFTESIDINLNLIRWRFDSHDLVTEKFIVGKRIKSEVRIVYLKSLANDTDIQTMRQRIKDLVIDEIEDSSILTQAIEDSSTSVFPQFYNTELPNRFAYSLANGRIGVLVDKSPTAIIAPTTLFSFFESTEDNYMRWNIGSFIRIMRFIAMFISIVLTPSYVAILTYHYEIIPTNLLVQLGKSRAQVPFPPLLEAILLEMLIELLREAGARLPTKVGQTMGIVGGIVLGQAAVDAGLTSNVLIIVVAMSALAAFTAPSYLMGSAVRVIRFPMILIAGFFGLFGVMVGICFLIIHLLKMTSLGRPYLLPAYPYEKRDMSKTFYHKPVSGNRRSVSYLLKDTIRFRRQRGNRKKDIDE